MLSRTELDATLAHLDALYASTIATDPRSSQYFCKLAVIEFCGWIEEAQDLLIQESALRGAIWDPILKEKVKKNYGYHFTDKFAPLLAYGMGNKQLQNVIATVTSRGGSKLDSAISTINSFVTKRNEAAHTHSRPGGKTFYQPSLIHSYLDTVADGLSELESELIAIGW